MVVVVNCPYGAPDTVVAFTEDEKALPYIKSKLKSWDIYSDSYQEKLEEVQTVEDAQILIEEEAIYTICIHVVDEIDPEVSEEVQQ